MGMTYGKHQFPYIQATAEYFDKSGNRPSLVRSAPKRDLDDIYLHNPIPKEEDVP